MLKDLALLKQAADKFTATADAMITGLNRAGGAREANSTKWERRQIRNVVSLGKVAFDALDQLWAATVTFDRDWAEFVTTLAPLDAIATSLQTNPVFAAMITFGKALLTLYPKVPEIVELTK